MLKQLIAVTLISYFIAGHAAQSLRVSPDGAYKDLHTAILKANANDTILIEGGKYEGHLKIDKSLTLIGNNFPVIDGGNEGIVIEITAPDVHIKGFVIENSGKSLSREDAGLSINAPRAIVENNRIQHVLFGAYLRKAHHAIIRNNEITGKEELPIPRRGDLVRVWYSDSVLIQNNKIRHGRDVIIWFSNGTSLVENKVTNARYGVHFMYSNDCKIQDNILTGNSVGAYLMYSRRLVLQRNTIAYNRGPSGFGIGLKDFDDGILKNNLIVDNRVGIFVDNSPREIESTMLYEGNVLAYNDVGISLLSFIKRSKLTENSFIDNYEQVGITGAGKLSGNHWINNYWGDYAGYDRNNDGVGDIPYKAEQLFENLMDQNPKLKLFIYSPAVQALEFAAQTFPLVKPQPKLEDPKPRMEPYIPAGLSSVSLPTQWDLIISAIGLLLIGSFISFGFPKKSTENLRTGKQNDIIAPGDKREPSMIKAKKLTKQFGKITAANNLTFSVQKGEAVAFWGANGAGKTTVLRCLLAVLPFDGSISINGLDVSKESKKVRKLIGFVPQEISFHDNLNVKETLEFYAQLKKTTADSIEDWIKKLGLDPHLEKTIKELSGGMKQKLALAIALLANPPILLLDEPTANLDMHSRDDFLELLTILKKEGKTIVFSSHRLEEVFSFADRVLILDQGSLIADCPPEEVYEKLGKKSFLLLHMPDSQTDSAIKILERNGFVVSQNGAGIKVKVNAHLKAEPITILANEGMSVNNFDYEVES